MDNPSKTVSALLEEWGEYIGKLQPVEIDLMEIVNTIVTPKINNSWSRKRKNEVSKPARRKIRQVRNKLIDAVVANVQLRDDAFQ